LTPRIALAAIVGILLMSIGRRPKSFLFAALLWVGWLWSSALLANPGATKQQSLDEWRSFTSPTSPPPRVFVRGDHVRFYFAAEDGIEAFNSHWTRFRVPTGQYRVSSALLRWDQRLSHVPEHERGWREATVIAGAEWRSLATNLIAVLTPETPRHGVYYQAFLSDRLLYRDAQGIPRVALATEHPQGIFIEHRFSMNETLELVAHQIGEHLAKAHPSDSLFLMMAPNARRFTQPLLLDRQQRQCVFLAPAALYDSNDPGGTLSVTAQGFWALLPESHGIALLKNPISSVARLADLAIVTLVKFIRMPLPKPTTQDPITPVGPGMNLDAWEAWLDHYTGTRLENGSLQLQIDGDSFFPRFRQAIADATNSIHINVYIFDKDDVAVDFADQLKRRSRELDVKVLLDRMGSIAGGASPPATPMPEDFVPPGSIVSYLRHDSRIKVRTFLNPWFSSDHAKVIMVDGDRAWLGGMNIGREYRYEWHDLMVELSGPVVNSLETEFRREWAHAGPLGDLAYTAAVLKASDKPTPIGPGPWMKVRLLPTKTAWKPFATAVLGSIRQAQKYVYVENPYLFDKRVILGLVKARSRGVDVRVVLPCFNDFKAGGRGNIVIANYLIEHGVRVYFYPAMTHVKALLVDGWACLGSGNLNHLSLRVNHEQNIASSDLAFATQVEQQLFEQDFARSFELKQPVSVDWVDFLADLALEGF
jgi:cardiolipin synthase A/B